MNVCIFVGPTLRGEEIAAVCDAICLPPVAQGDVYRAAQQNPRVIGIIDGFFSGAPSVWHKEILWALSQGIQVFGSASMGALRAAELHRFGMRGVGRIFEGFRDGTLEDDDEVAVVHGPGETGFLAASESMVNIRATLARAEGEGVLSPSSRGDLETFAKSLFFPYRTWPALLRGAQSQGLTAGELLKFREWLPQGRVDQKRGDALEMLAAIKEALVQPEPPRPDFHFEWTNFWDEFVAGYVPEPATYESSPSFFKSVLEELRLEGKEAYGRVKDRALVRLFAGLEARRRGLEPSLEAKRSALARTREALGLFTRAELESWISRNDLDVPLLERLIEEDARVQIATGPTDSLPDRYLLDELRLSGGYERLAERAHRKEALLTKAEGGAEGKLLGQGAIALRLWYFEKRLGVALPDDVAAFARELGFSNVNDFDDALRREYSFSGLIIG
jgi:hypothetical protein